MIRRLALVALTLAPLPAAAQEADSAAILAGGCFWCVEADFEGVEGVGDAISGFTGGTTPDPEYRRSGDHIEAVRVPYDSSEIDYRRIVELFLRSIDPFDAGGQFCDRGLEYTPAIFALDAEQRRIAEEEIAEAEAELGREIVVPVRDGGEFYPVGDYHQDYYKSEDRLGITSVGLAVTKATAYKRYRDRCGRDERVREVWGEDAPFLPDAQG
jgi:peptide-methionine (S)-S-oxide reductase